MHDEANGDHTSRSLFRRNLIRVLSVQAVALVVLWLLQARYAG